MIPISYSKHQATSTAMSFQTSAPETTVLDNLACCGWTYTDFRLFPNARKALFKQGKSWGLWQNEKDEWEGFTWLLDGNSLHIPCAQARNVCPTKMGTHAARLKSNGAQMQKQCAACVRHEINAVQRSRYQSVTEKSRSFLPWNRDTSSTDAGSFNVAGVKRDNNATLGWSDPNSDQLQSKKVRHVHRNTPFNAPVQDAAVLPSAEIDLLKNNMLAVEAKLQIIINHLLASNQVQGMLCSQPLDNSTSSNSQADI